MAELDTIIVLLLMLGSGCGFAEGAMCPDGVTQVPGFFNVVGDEATGRYFFLNTWQGYAFQTAQLDCSNKGGNLALIRSLQEARILFNLMSSGKEFYVGLTNPTFAHYNMSDPGSTLVWIDGTPFSNDLLNQPELTVEENQYVYTSSTSYSKNYCFFAYSNNGKLIFSQRTCTTGLNFICQFDCSTGFETTTNQCPDGRSLASDNLRITLDGSTIHVGITPSTNRLVYQMGTCEDYGGETLIPKTRLERVALMALSNMKSTLYMPWVTTSRTACENETCNDIFLHLDGTAFSYADYQDVNLRIEASTHGYGCYRIYSQSTYYVTYPLYCESSAFLACKYDCDTAAPIANKCPDNTTPRPGKVFTLAGQKLYSANPWSPTSTFQYKDLPKQCYQNGGSGIFFDSDDEDILVTRLLLAITRQSYGAHLYFLGDQPCTNGECNGTLYKLDGTQFNYSSSWGDISFTRSSYNYPCVISTSINTLTNTRCDTRAKFYCKWSCDNYKNPSWLTQCDDGKMIDYKTYFQKDRLDMHYVTKSTWHQSIEQCNRYAHGPFIPQNDKELWQLKVSMMVDTALVLPYLRVQDRVCVEDDCYELIANHLGDLLPPDDWKDFLKIPSLPSDTSYCLRLDNERTLYSTSCNSVRYPCRFDCTKALPASVPSLCDNYLQLGDTKFVLSNDISGSERMSYDSGLLKCQERDSGAYPVIRSKQDYFRLRFGARIEVVPSSSFWIALRNPTEVSCGTTACLSSLKWSDGTAFDPSLFTIQYVEIDASHGDRMFVFFNSQGDMYFSSKTASTEAPVLCTLPSDAECKLADCEGDPIPDVDNATYAHVSGQVHVGATAT